MGTLPGWWLGEHDDRAVEPYVSPQRWSRHMYEAGLELLPGSHFDGELNWSMVAAHRSDPPARMVTILHSGSQRSTLKAVHDAFCKKGYTVTDCPLGIALPQGVDIFSIIDIEQPFFYNISDENFEKFKDLLTEVSPSAGVLWVTGACQIDCHDPRYALALGMARTIRVEQNIDFGTLELDQLDNSVWDTTVSVFEEFQSRTRDGELDATMEWVLSDGVVKVGRFAWVNLDDELKEQSSTVSQRTLEIDLANFNDSLKWRTSDLGEPTSDLISIRVYATGLSFKDKLITTGILDVKKLGFQCAGIVEKVGPGVATLIPGDRVVAIVSGAVATAIITPEKLCAKIPAGLPFDLAASMPLAYGTAIYGLMDKANLRKGQSVLIHDACSDIGLAALQIASMIQAQVRIS